MIRSGSVIKRSLAVASLAAVWTCLSMVPSASGRLAANTIDTVATISVGGHRLLVSGPFTCTQREWMDLRVTVTQRTTGAVAEGTARFEGDTFQQHWALKANVMGDARFEPGPATVVAFATTSLGPDVTDAHQWLVNVNLVEQ